MSHSKHKKSPIRSFERADRIQGLLDKGVIKRADEIPADAIPALADFILRCRTSLSMWKRAPYFVDTEYRCTDCKRPFVWKAEEQRFWYEQLQGSPYATAARCQRCRRKRRGESTK